MTLFGQALSVLCFSWLCSHSLPLSGASGALSAIPFGRSLNRGWKPGTDSTIPLHRHFLISQRTDGSSYLINSGHLYHSDISRFCLVLHINWQTTKDNLIVLSAHVSYFTKSSESLCLRSLTYGPSPIPSCPSCFIRGHFIGSSSSYQGVTEGGGCTDDKRTRALRFVYLLRFSNGNLKF